MNLRKVLDVRGRRGLRTVVAQIILLSLVLGMFPTPARAALPHVFNDGFESGTLSNWTTPVGLVVQQDEVYAGEYAVRATSTTGTPAYAYKQLSQTYTELYYRLWFKIISQGETNQVVLQRFRTASNTAILAAFVGQNGTLNLRNEFTNANVMSAVAVPQGVWHQLQTRIVINGASSQTEVWLNGVRVDALSITQDLGTTPVGTIQLGETSNFRMFDVALDRVAVDTEFIDPADPVEITPTAANVDVWVAGVQEGDHTLEPNQALRADYPVDGGPVQVISDQDIVAAERFIYKVKGLQTSYSEITALPNSQLDNTYWLPWYNNVGLDSQLRIANASNATATVHVTIDGVPVTGSPFTLLEGESMRERFAGIDAGPVKISSNQNIVASERFIYKVQGTETSYSEIMALPNSQVDTTYWLPWYNNVGLSSQLRIANVDNATATVHVTIGGTPVPGSPFTLLAGESMRESFAGIDDGPVKIVSNQDIVASERFIYKAHGAETSYSEIMALPNSQLDTTYWLPWYNNTGLDSQLRFANVDNATATVRVYIGGVEMLNSPFTLQPDESVRVSFDGIDAGPVQIVSDQDIVASERFIYKVQGKNTSYSEIMAVPNTALDSTYWLPWYNNVGLSSQLRFGLP